MRDKSGRFSKAPKRTQESDIADIYWMVSELKRDLKGMRGEIGERLRMFELRLEQLREPLMPLDWTYEQRKAFLSGLKKV